MTSDKLLCYAEDHDIEVLWRKTPLNGSISACVDGDCYIAVDDCEMTEAVLKTHLCHEVGHCETGMFYSPHTPLQTRGRCEYRANVWAVKKLIPKDKLLKAVKKGIVELWDIAEYFNVTEGFAVFAIKYYSSKDV